MDVTSGPTGDSCGATDGASFHDFVGPQQQGLRQCQADRSCGLHIGDELKLDRLDEGNFGGRRPLEQVSDLICRRPRDRGHIGCVGQQATIDDIVAIGIDRRELMLDCQSDDRLAIVCVGTGVADQKSIDVNRPGFLENRRVRVGCYVRIQKRMRK